MWRSLVRPGGCVIVSSLSHYLASPPELQFAIVVFILHLPSNLSIDWLQSLHSPSHTLCAVGFAQDIFPVFYLPFSPQKLVRGDVAIPELRSSPERGMKRTMGAQSSSLLRWLTSRFWSRFRGHSPHSKLVSLPFGFNSAGIVSSSSRFYGIGLT